MRTKLGTCWSTQRSVQRGIRQWSKVCVVKLKPGHCAHPARDSHLPCVMRRKVGFVRRQQHLQLGVICKASGPIEEDLSAGSCGQKGQHQ